MSLFATVIVYTYDRKDYIVRAVDSVLNQSLDRGSYEVIVVKGFSDHGIESELQNKVDTILHVPEKGHGKKITEGLKKAKGDVIFILDDDDEFEENRLQVCMSYFENDSSLIFIHNSMNKIEEDGAYIRGSVESAPSQILRLNTNDLKRKDLSAFIKYRANWYSSCMGFRKSVFENKLKELESVDQSVDPFLFFLVLSSEGDMVMLPDRLTKYRVHSSTTNYLLPYGEFIERRKTFYQNSSRIFKRAAEFSSSSKSYPQILALSGQMNFISSIMKGQMKRGNQVRNFLDYMKTYRYILTRYQFVWLFIGLAKLLSHRVAMSLFYMYYKRTVGNSL